MSCDALRSNSDFYQIIQAMLLKSTNIYASRQGVGILTPWSHVVDGLLVHNTVAAFMHFTLLGCIFTYLGIVYIFVDFQSTIKVLSVWKLLSIYHFLNISIIGGVFYLQVGLIFANLLIKMCYNCNYPGSYFDINTSSTCSGFGG